MSVSRRPTMRDVAAEAGVSFKTVSRVVNREGGVSPTLVDRVEKAVATLGYRPDHRARLLRRSSTAPATIGFVWIDIANAFFSSVLRGIEEVADTRNCLVLAGSTEWSPEREQRLVDALVERRVGGLIVVSSGAAAATLQSEMQRGTPLVFLDLEPGFDVVDLVRTDHRAGAIKATEHLIAGGHTNIAYFGDDLDIFSARERLEGFRTAMANAGLKVDDRQVITGSHSGDKWRTIIRSFFEDGHRKPTAAFTAQNFVTLGAVQGLHDLNLRSTVAHVGFDDIDLAEAVTPGVTVIPQYPRQLGRRAAEMLFNRVETDSVEPVKVIVEPPLVKRGSGEIPPAG